MATPIWVYWAILIQITIVWKPRGQIPTLKAPFFYVKGLRQYCLFSFGALLKIYSSLLEWFHCLHAALPDKYSTALISQTSWGLQHNLSSTFIASYNDFSGPPCRDSTATCLSLRALPNHRGILDNPFSHIAFIILKPEPCGSHCQFEY